MSTQVWEEFVAQLEEAGYFKYAEPDLVPEMKAEVVQARSIWPMPSDLPLLTKRVYPGDAERLTEGGVLAFLWQLSPVLQQQGVIAPIYMDQDFKVGQFAYTVTVNLTEYPMLKQDEYGEGIPYVLVTGRAFALINDLLQKTSSHERMYSVRDTIGERSIGVLLTPELFQLINNNPLVPEGDQLLTAEEVIALGK
jgi:hypothetical protein